jgi:hypothetical protein
MGERSWARLTIGGPVSRRALADALETLVGCRLDECLEDDQVVVEDPDAAWGGFSELEAWLEARGIPFDLESAARSGVWPDIWCTSDRSADAWSSRATTATRSPRARVSCTSTSGVGASRTNRLPSGSAWLSPSSA